MDLLSLKAFLSQQRERPAEAGVGVAAGSGHDRLCQGAGGALQFAVGKFAPVVAGGATAVVGADEVDH